MARFNVNQPKYAGPAFWLSAIITEAACLAGLAWLASRKGKPRPGGWPGVDTEQ